MPGLSASWLVVALLAVAWVPAASAGQVAQTPFDSITPVVSRSGATIHVAWIEVEPTTDGLRATILAARSLDGGVAFESPRIVAALTGFANSLRMQVDGPTVHLAWLVSSYTLGSPAAVDYAVSRDGGNTFSEAIALNDAAAPGSPELAILGEQVAIAWSAGQTAWITVSTDAGLHFGAPHPVSGSEMVVDGSARVAQTEGGPAVVWLAIRGGIREFRFASLSQSNPPEVSAPVGLSSEGAPASEPSLAASGNRIVVAWVDGSGSRSLRVRHSTDGGTTFSESSSPGKPDVLAQPRLAIADGQPLAVWAAKGGKMRISRTAEDRKGRVIAKKLSPASYPSLAVSGAVVVVAIQSGGGENSRVQVLVSSDGGLTFGTPLTPGLAAVPVGAPSVATDGSAASVVWQMPLSPESTENEIFHMDLALP